MTVRIYRNNYEQLQYMKDLTYSQKSSRISTKVITTASIQKET